jgi:hypothetical protein
MSDCGWNGRNAARLFSLLSMLGAAAGCAPQQYRISVAPSLRPVDAARPMVVFSQIQGKACGRDAVLGAIRDMKRLNGVDGYLEVVVEETGAGDERCAKVTAYPFRYGESTETPGLRAGEESTAPQLVPGGMASCPMHGMHHGEGEGQGPGEGAVPAIDCKARCGEIAALVEPATIKQALIADRCEQRCSANDASFRSCIAAATTAAAANTCLQPAPAGGSR